MSDKVNTHQLPSWDANIRIYYIDENGVSDITDNLPAVLLLDVDDEHE